MIPRLHILIYLLLLKLSCHDKKKIPHLNGLIQQVYSLPMLHVQCQKENKFWSIEFFIVTECLPFVAVPS